jgi:hypothetical protein
MTLRKLKDDDANVSFRVTMSRCEYGILQNKPNTGEVANVCIFGVCPAIIGADVTAGGDLVSDKAGNLIDQTSTNPKVAMALEDGSADDQIISVKIIPTPG